MLSVIIPTLNEEKTLPLLLKSIGKQNFKGYEIIIADANSTDKTVEVAKKHKCKVVLGGLPGPGRNNGAKVAKGDLLLFLDADVIIPEMFFEKALNEFEQRKLDITTFTLFPQEENGFFKFVLNFFYNKPAIFFEKTLPHAAMGIIIKKDLFEKLNGYDETVTLAEDHDLARRAQKIAQFGIIRSSYLYISDRRFKKDGWIKTGLKYFLCESHMVFLGPVKSKSSVFKYKFGHYDEN